MILSVSDLSFCYNGRTVLDSVSFSLAQGELLAILGPNGVGKTTLLRCMNGMLRPKAGTVMVEGADVFRMSCGDIARRLGYVAQRSEAGRMTAFDAVLLGRKPHMGWRATEHDLRMADAALAHVGLAHLALRHINEMSGGELQKICIARALVQEPRIMLLDEPTSSLDLRNQLDILGTIRHVVRDHQVAAIMTMHDLNTALRYADRLLFIKDGQIFAHCSPGDVRAEVIQAVYGVAVEIISHGGQTIILPKHGEHKEEA